VGSNACAGYNRKCLSRNMERFHASTGLARLPYFLAVPCLSPQLQSILSLFVHREPDVPSNYRLNWPYINNLSKRLNGPLPKNRTKGLIDVVGHGIWQFEGRIRLGPRVWRSTSLRGEESPIARYLRRRGAKQSSHLRARKSNRIVVRRATSGLTRCAHRRDLEPLRQVGIPLQQHNGRRPSIEVHYRR